MVYTTSCLMKRKDSCRRERDENGWLEFAPLSNSSNFWTLLFVERRTQCCAAAAAAAGRVSTPGWYRRRRAAHIRPKLNELSIWLLHGTKTFHQL
jgi:hypothetical protein